MKHLLRISALCLALIITPHAHADALSNFSQALMKVSELQHDEDLTTQEFQHLMNVNKEGIPIYQAKIKPYINKNIDQHSKPLKFSGPRTANAGEMEAPLLTLAVMYNDDATVEKLLNAGADPNAKLVVTTHIDATLRRVMQSTPLYLAIKNLTEDKPKDLPIASKNIAKMLLEKNADKSEPAWTSQYIETPQDPHFQNAIGYEEISNILKTRTPLPATKAHFEEVKKMLLK